MSIMASWLSKKWLVDSNIVTALNELNFTKELDVEEQDTKEGKSPTAVKGFKPQKLETSHKVSRSAGGDPRKEFEEWQKLLGKRGGFHIAGTRIGPAALILDRVEIAVTALNNDGEFMDAQILLTFSEDTSFAPAPKVAVEKYVGDTYTESDTPGYRPNGTEKAGSAYNVRPNASAAEAKS